MQRLYCTKSTQVGIRKNKISTMTLDLLQKYCSSLPNVTESFPFDNDHIVFKVYDKMFALTNVKEFKSMNVKCDPKKAIELREKHDAIIAGYHMNKKHWNTIFFDGSMSDAVLFSYIKDSYELVLKGVSKNKKQR